MDLHATAYEAMMSVIQTALEIEPRSVPYPNRSSKTKPSYKHRLVTAVFHLLLGTVLLIVGNLVVNLRFPGEDPMGTPVRYGRDEGDVLDHMDSQFWGMWMGLTMVFASVFGFLSKKNKCLISFYMASNVMTFVVATMGVIIGALYVGSTARFMDKLLHRYNEVPKYPKYRYPCFVPSSVVGSSRVETVDDMTQQLFDECIQLHTEAARAHLPFYCIMLTCFVLEFANTCFAFRFTCLGLGCCSSSARSERARRNRARAYFQQHHRVTLQSMASQPVATLPVGPGQVFTPSIHDLPPPYASLNFPHPAASQRTPHGIAPLSTALNPQLGRYDAVRPPYSSQNGPNDAAEGTEAGLPSYEEAVILSLDGGSTT